MGVYKPNPTVETVDGTTEVKNVGTIKVSNGDLSVSGRTATVDTSGSGSATLTRYQIGYGDASNLLTGNARFLQTSTDTIVLGEPAQTGALGGAPRLTMAGDTALLSIYGDNATSGDQIAGIRVLSDPFRSGGMMIMDYDNSDGSTTERVLFGRQYGSSNKFGISEAPENGGDEIFTVDTNTNQITINGDSDDYDFYVRGNSASNYTKWDAGAGVVTFQKMRVVITSDDTIQPGLQLYEANDDAGAGPRMYFRRDSTSPAAFDDLGNISWYGSVIDGATVTNDKKYSEIYAEIRSPTKDEQSGILRFYNYYLGANDEYMRLDSKSVNIGYNSGDAIDFKIYDDDSSTTLFHADASENAIGIGGTVGSTNRLRIEGGDGSDGSTGTVLRIVYTSTDTTPNGRPGIEIVNQDAGATNSLAIFRMKHEAGVDSDFEMTHDTFGNTKFYSQQPNTNAMLCLQLGSSLVLFNGENQNMDFRVDGEYSDKVLFIDGSKDRFSHIQYVMNKTDDYTALAEDCYGSTITIYHASAKTLTLPTAVKGMHLKCINYGGGGTVAVDANGTETINGSTAQITLSIAFNTADLVCTETGKWVCNVLGVSS